MVENWVEKMEYGSKVVAMAGKKASELVALMVA